MAKRRPDDFDLRAAIRSPAFTPAGADVAPLLDAVCGDDEAFADEAEHAGIAAEAGAVIERNLAASAPSAIDVATAPPRPLPVVARCRRGLARLLAEELRAFAPRVSGEGDVSFMFASPLSALWAART